MYGVPCCCFNHLISLPEKPNDFDEMEAHPIYPYEMELYDSLLIKGEKWQWVKKATGLGITEFYLRLIAWLCVNAIWRSKFANSQVCIIVGPNLDLGKKIMKRVKYTFSEVKTSPKLPLLKQFVLEGHAKELVINDVTITIFPSNHLDAMRGLPNVSMIMIDEGDYFPPNEQLNVLTVSTRYVAKSGAWIVMVSTPGEPGGLFETIEKDKISPFKKHFFNYERGMAKYGANMFTEQAIENARKSMSPADFQREYDLEYKGFSGNLFTVEFLYRLQKKSIYPVIQQIEDIDQDTRLRSLNVGIFDDFVYNENSMQYYRILAIDPGYASSKFGISIMQINFQTNQVEVIYEAEFDSANSKEMVDLITYLVKVLRIKKVAVDRSDVDFIRNLKEELKDYEDIDYRKLTREELMSYIEADMIVCPITFSAETKREMLYHMRDLIQGGYVLINESMKMHFDALSTVKIGENMKFNKKEVLHNDVLDAFMEGLYLIHF